MTLQSAIYEGEVVHERRRPARHRLRYGVFSMLFDIDELGELDRRFALFAHNRWAPLSFHDRDHGPTTGAALRPWVERHMRGAGLAPDGGAIRLLCYPRIFGFVFNPLSVFFCYRRDGGLAAILYEVCNTYKERHTYVIPVVEPANTVVRQRCDKAMYVSPFVDMATTYDFRIVPPASRTNIVIRQEDADGLLLAASFNGRRVPLDGRALANTLCRFPLMTLKIVAAIHWEAMHLYLKNVPFFAHRPASRPVDATIATPS